MTLPLADPASVKPPREHFRQIVEKPRRVTDAWQCRAFTFERQLAAVLGEESPVAHPALDEDALMDRMGHAGLYALFHLQNTECFSRLRLRHIVESRALLSHFLRLARLVQRVGEPDAREWEAERAWFAAQPTHTARDTPVVPFIVDATPEPDEATPRERMWHNHARLVLGAKPSQEALERERAWWNTQIERVLVDLGTTWSEVTRVQHARTQLTHLLLVRRRAWTHKSKVRSVCLAAEAAYAERWLHTFLRHGCACAR
ncbi:MAG: hypothetical protein Q7V62_16910 [Actinomycetota bacterium]|nr:hypothetical protein [Actinomycetota bacterium]